MYWWYSKSYLVIFFIGVYIHSTGEFVGDHAVKLIGWDSKSNWLLINSFGEKWGDNGTFLMPEDYKRSNCDFGYAIIAPKLDDNYNSDSITSHGWLYLIQYIMLYSMLNIFFLNWNLLKWS